MICIPEKIVENLRKIIEWDLKGYGTDGEIGMRLERISENFYKRNLVEDKVQIEESDLYYIDECVSTAINYSSECEVEIEAIRKIKKWIVKERNKVNR